MSQAPDVCIIRWARIIRGRDLLLVEQAMEILSHYHREDAKATDYIFPLLSNDAEYAGYVTQADKDRMKPELRHKMYQDISSKTRLSTSISKRLPRKPK